MASAADPILQDEYDKYVFEMEEMGQQPMSLEDFRQQAVAGMATGGIARLGYANGQLVQPTRHGVRPGYRGDAAYRSGSEQASSIGQGNVGTQSDFGDGPAQGGGGGGKRRRRRSLFGGWVTCRRERARSERSTARRGRGGSQSRRGKTRRWRRDGTEASSRTSWCVSGAGERDTR